jgi:hypothetical protein
VEAERSECPSGDEKERIKREKNYRSKMKGRGGAYVDVLACESWTLYPYAVVGFGVRRPDDHRTVSIAYTELYVTVQRKSHKTYTIYVDSVNVTFRLQMCL